MLTLFSSFELTFEKTFMYFEFAFTMLSMNIDELSMSDLAFLSSDPTNVSRS